MATLNVALPAGVIPVDGLQVSFRVPCDCASFTHIEIAGSRYTLIDTNGDNMAARSGVWSAGAMLSVILDVANRAAYLQNSATVISRCSFAYTEEPYALYGASAGCITLFADTSDTGAARHVRVFDNMFKPGDVLEICRNCSDNVYIEFTDSYASGPTVTTEGTLGTSVVLIPHKYGVAKFIFMPDRSFWLASGDVAEA